MDSKATINLPLTEYFEMQKQIGERDQKIAELEKQVKAEQLKDPSERVHVLMEALMAVKPVVQFAVSHLPPEAVRGWPYKELRKFGGALTSFPGGDQDTIELGRDLLVFASEVQPFEEARARGEKAPARVGGPG